MTASTIFKEAGMHLRKFHTNSENLIHYVGGKNKLSNFQNSNDSLKVLGLLWDTNSDVLRFDVQSFPDDWKFNPTKRLVLKAMLKISDPIGFIAPFSIRMKMLLQETW
ncbi:reverse transcriptase domain-containing protein [Trichonephila clavata]|uniref:Reverse transcriptase domain-containing protein n=1 Tax=Trichonephila clavata TaxID=2740835 RepID=A0A8X6HGZ9_TRICU|nr:reverse transcriptase domain-containing protein [Trichonephila clavata]